MTSEPSSLLVQRQLHQRRTGSSIMLADGDAEPVILDGLAADVWLLAKWPITARQIEKALANRFRDSSPLFVESARLAITMVTPYLATMPPGAFTLESTLGQSAGALPSWSATDFCDDPTALGRLFDWPNEQAAVLRAAAQASVGRPYAAGGPVLEVPAGPRLAFRQRVLPGLVAAIETGGWRDVHESMALIARQNATVQRKSIRCEQVLLHVVSRLEELGVEYRGLKGVVTAHLDYPEPHLRQFADVDLLVRADDHTPVLEVLKRDGFRHVVGGDPGAYDLYKSNYLIAPNGVEVDLHHRLFRHGLPHGEVWSAPDTVIIAGRHIAAPSRPWRLLHACAHAMFSRGPTRHLSMFLDPVRILHNDPEALDEMAGIASRLQLRGLVTAGLAQSYLAVGVRSMPSPTRSSGVRDRVALWAFGEPERHALREQVSLLLGLSPGEAARWIHAWLAPSSDYTGPKLLDRIRSRTMSKSSNP